MDKQQSRRSKDDPQFIYGAQGTGAGQDAGPKRDTVIIDDVYVPLHIDPSVRDARGTVWQGSKLILDATQKIDSGPFSLPPKELMAKALSVWKESGLPELEIPRRARLRIERS
jgi:3-polyprenyl-4-hydroxybenzoate decarboxylase